jgi:hypothetical protein
LQRPISLLLCCCALVGRAGAAEPEAVYPPAATGDVARVVRTVPDNRVYYAPADLERIVVEFDRPMRRDGFAYQADPRFPERFPWLTGAPRVSDDGRTWEFPVSLKPDTRYMAWLNTPQWSGFVAEDGSPGEWYKLAFRTGRR